MRACEPARACVCVCVCVCMLACMGMCVCACLGVCMRAAFKYMSHCVCVFVTGSVCGAFISVCILCQYICTHVGVCMCISTFSVRVIVCAYMK